MPFDITQSLLGVNRTRPWTGRSWRVKDPVITHV